MKYRRKPAIFDAEKFKFPTTLKEREYWHNQRVLWNGVDNFFFIYTLEGAMKVNDGDWIVTGIKGEKWPVKPDIFELTYELVKGE